MRLYNTLTKKVEDFQPLKDKTVRLYSCGPTVYDRAHIGNLSAYIFADTLRRALQASGYEVTHVMNYTDVDDKTITRSRERYPDLEPREALKKLTDEYIALFLEDCKKVGIDVEAMQFVRATDNIEAMQHLIKKLLKANIAYLTDDGIYFSIEAYKKAGKTYGQLLNLSSDNTSQARIDNDEYDKESVHDFALWKKEKEGEPAWDFDINGKNIAGRPGWHIECSAMSETSLGLPFDIHTGGVDLIFPHHENEIAQSTAVGESNEMARFFTHNEHVLVDGKKMAKSAGNFITLQEIEEKGFNPLAFRLLVLQSHYQNQVHFSWENLVATQNSLKNIYATADIKCQPHISSNVTVAVSHNVDNIEKAMQDNLQTPAALRELKAVMLGYGEDGISKEELNDFQKILENFDRLFGLQLADRTDITEEQKSLITQRDQAKREQNFAQADSIRHQLKQQGIGLEDRAEGTRWYRL